MSKESMFFIYCIERYRYFKGLTGADATKIFDQYNIYSYVLKYFETLHTMGDRYIIQDIDDYISSFSCYIDNNTKENSNHETKRQIHH